jgi:hypothetical protein
MKPAEGKFTVETFAKQQGLSRQSSINLLSKLKKQGLVQTSGGGRQKRIYTISKTPRKEPNGLFTVLNKYSPEKINPAFEHHIHGKYGPEHALVDGISIIKGKKDVRLREAMLHLFRHVKDWKLLFDMAKKEDVVAELQELYSEARQKTRTRTMPKRYRE